jgi:hypothetical protein
MCGRTHALPVDPVGSFTVGLVAATEGVLAFLVAHCKCDFQNHLDSFLHATKVELDIRWAFEALPMRC